MAFECISSLAKEFREPVPDFHEECPRMCKNRFKKTSMKGYPLEDIYAALGETKVFFYFYFFVEDIWLYYYEL